MRAQEDTVYARQELDDERDRFADEIRQHQQEITDLKRDLKSVTLRSKVATDLTGITLPPSETTAELDERIQELTDHLATMVTERDDFQQQLREQVKTIVDVFSDVVSLWYLNVVVNFLFRWKPMSNCW